MKKCPYCAEMIQDEAIKCRYCFSDLRVPPDEAIGGRPTSAAAGGTGTSAPVEVATPTASTPPGGPSPSSRPAPGPAAFPTSPNASTTPGPDPSPSASGAQGSPGAAHVAMPSVSSGAAAAVRYTHSGYRYVLGYGTDFFGIWDRQSPSEPAERFARTDDGWRQAWLRFAGLEPNHVAVPGGSAAPTGAASMGGVAADTAAEQYTHSGARYLLGYGRDFFGIWDRHEPSKAVERFPRTDAGWADAWRRYTQIETHFTEVSLGKPSGP